MLTDFFLKYIFLQFSGSLSAVNQIAETPAQVTGIKPVKSDPLITLESNQFLAPIFYSYIVMVF